MTKGSAITAEVMPFTSLDNVLRPHLEVNEVAHAFMNIIIIFCLSLRIGQVFRMR